MSSRVLALACVIGAALLAVSVSAHVVTTSPKLPPRGGDYRLRMPGSDEYYPDAAVSGGCGKGKECNNSIHNSSTQALFLSRTH
jgi:hypothetical protein